MSWMPAPVADSVRMEHVAFRISDDIDRNDTLTFNIFVEPDTASTRTGPSVEEYTGLTASEITAIVLSGKIKLTMPTFVTSVSFYDIAGREVGKVVPVISGQKACVIWPGLSSEGTGMFSGKFVARIAVGAQSIVKTFVVVP